MTKVLIIKPAGWPCTLDECAPGFFVANGQLCFKSEYGRADGSSDAFNSAGEAYHSKSDELIQPVIEEWIDDE